MSLHHRQNARRLKRSIRQRLKAKKQKPAKRRLLNMPQWFILLIGYGVCAGSVWLMTSSAKGNTAVLPYILGQQALFFTGLTLMRAGSLCVSLFNPQALFYPYWGPVPSAEVSREALKAWFLQSLRILVIPLAFVLGAGDFGIPLTMLAAYVLSQLCLSLMLSLLLSQSWVAAWSAFPGYLLCAAGVFSTQSVGSSDLFEQIILWLNQTVYQISPGGWLAHALAPGNAGLARILLTLGIACGFAVPFLWKRRVANYRLEALFGYDLDDSTLEPPEEPRAPADPEEVRAELRKAYEEVGKPFDEPANPLRWLPERFSQAALWTFGEPYPYLAHFKRATGLLLLAWLCGSYISGWPRDAVFLIVPTYFSLALLPWAGSGARGLERISIIGKDWRLIHWVPVHYTSVILSLLAHCAWRCLLALPFLLILTLIAANTYGASLEASLKFLILGWCLWLGAQPFILSLYTYGCHQGLRQRLGTVVTALVDLLALAALGLVAYWLYRENLSWPSVIGSTLLILIIGTIPQLVVIRLWRSRWTDLIGLSPKQ